MKEIVRNTQPHSRRARLLLAVVVTFLGWALSFLNLAEQNLILFGAAGAMCLGAGLATFRHGLLGGLVIILAALPYFVIRARHLAAVLAKDLDDHRWTAHAIDTQFGSALIATRVILISAFALVLVEFVAYVRAVTTRLT